MLSGRRQVLMRSEPEKPARTSAKSGGGRKKAAPADLPEEALPVFERLRAWRAATAREQGVPAYVVFHDATLREIAAAPPATLAELGTVSGVGENKLAKYGQSLLDALAEED